MTNFETIEVLAKKNEENRKGSSGILIKNLYYKNGRQIFVARFYLSYNRTMSFVQFYLFHLQMQGFSDQAHIRLYLQRQQ